MPTLQPFPFGAFVVESAFLGDTAAFALGDGTVRLAAGVAAETVPVHAGAILVGDPQPWTARRSSPAAMTGWSR